jgi:hypothetical protein
MDAKRGFFSSLENSAVRKVERRARNGARSAAGSALKMQSGRRFVRIMQEIRIGFA